MGALTDHIVFFILAAIIVVFSSLTVVAKRMLRAAIYLFFVLLGTAGIYLMLNYHFLAAVQTSIYAGGILILFIFAILLTRPKGDRPERNDRENYWAGSLTAIAGIVMTTLVLLKQKFLYTPNPSITEELEINMKTIGHALLGTEKYQYILPFEALSILLLTCIIGGILIARKR